MKTAIIVGASSGIGAALAKVLIANGYSVTIIARRAELLQQLQQELGPNSQWKQGDVTDAPKIMALLDKTISEMGQVHLLVISAGVGFINQVLDWEPEATTIAVNVSGWAAVANVAMQHFLQQKAGHLVNISSIAALRGSRHAPAYHASKAFTSVYMDGLRQMVNNAGVAITITDIQAGLVDTAMAKGDGLFWLASPEKAASQIYTAIRLRKAHAYVTKRWRLIAWFVKWCPDWLYLRLT